MLIPCRRQANLRDYFEPIASDKVDSQQCLFSLRITGDGRYKVGLLPENIPGRVAYARPVEQGVLVIYRQFFPQPWRPYCDVPMHDIQSQGDVLQVVNDSGDSGGFGEMGR